MAPERLIINKVEKLVPNLGDKKEYIVHYQMLIQLISLGLEITKIHSGITFSESDWMKPYIDLNTNLRMKATNSFEKDFFKLMNNSVFGKTMEDIRKRIDIKLVSSEKLSKKWITKPNFKGRKIFSKDLVAIHMGKTKLYFNKPIYLGMTILDISKILIYDFHYNFIKEKYGKKAKLLFTDTDSLCYEIETKDFYKDISPFVLKKFDTSNFEPGHLSGIQTGVNKKVIGMMKDEMGGRIIREFVGLRPKLYSILMDDYLEIKNVKE